MIFKEHLIGIKHSFEETSVLVIHFDDSAILGSEPKT